MAATFVVIRRDNLGTSYQTYVKMTGDNSYPTGGYPVTPRDVGLGDLTAIVPSGSNTAGTLLAAVFDQEADKILVSAAGVQEPNATDLHAVDFYFVCIGI